MSEQFYSVKSAPLAGEVIDWFHVQMADGSYVYMLSQQGVARATKTHNFQLTRFSRNNGWNVSQERVSTDTSVLLANVKSPDGKERESQLYTPTQISAFILDRAVSGDAYCVELAKALMAESLETRFDQLFNKPLKPVEVKDTELAAKLTMHIQEETIKNLGDRLNRAGGSVSQKRQFLNTLLEGHTAQELVDKDLVDSTGKVIRKAGTGKGRSYLKLNLVDPSHAEALRKLYQAVAFDMCFIPAGTPDIQTLWLTIATTQLKKSKLPPQVKQAMLSRVAAYCV